MNLKELREWGNLILTVLTVFGVGYLNLKFANQKLEIESLAKDTYATKVDFGKLADSDLAQWKSIQDTRDQIKETKSAFDLKLQHITDVVLRETNNRNQNK